MVFDYPGNEFLPGRCGAGHVLSKSDIDKIDALGRLREGERNSRVANSIPINRPLKSRHVDAELHLRAREPNGERENEKCKSDSECGLFH